MVENSTRDICIIIIVIILFDRTDRLEREKMTHVTAAVIRVLIGARVLMRVCKSFSLGVFFIMSVKRKRKQSANENTIVLEKKYDGLPETGQCEAADKSRISQYLLCKLKGKKPRWTQAVFVENHDWKPCCDTKQRGCVIKTNVQRVCAIIIGFFTWK